MGDGQTPDTVAANAALADLGCGEVVFSNGTFKTGTLHLRSHLRLVVAPSGRVLARGQGHNDYDLAEANPFDMYQVGGVLPSRDAIFT